MERHAGIGPSARIELHARAGRVVLVGYDHRALPQDLVLALQEWARVAQAAHNGGGREVRTLASSRGRQLATRVAGHAGVVVGYADPVEGGIEQVRPVTDARAEPTPWATGLTVSTVTAAVTVLTVVALAEALAETSRWLAALATVLVAAGLAPSVWLSRRVPVWRWVGYGVATGIGCAWLVLLLSLLG